MKRTALMATVAIASMAVSSAAAAASFDFWYGHSGPIAKAIESLCDGFNQSQREHQVHCTSQGTYEQTMLKGVAAYRAGRQPAVIEIYDVGTLDMMLSGAVYPVSRLMDDTGHPVDWTDYLGPVLSYYAGADGKPDSLPFNASTLVLYVHRAKLAAAGVDHAPRTWEEFEAIAAKLKANGYPCPAITDYDPWKMLEQTNASQGVPIAKRRHAGDALDVEYVFNTGIHRRLMNDVMRWRAGGLLIDAAQTRTGNQALAFASSECVMSADSTSSWSAIMAGEIADIGVSVIPVYAQTSRHSTIVGGASLWVMKGYDAAVYRAVAAFFVYLRQPANQITFAMQTGYLPVTRRAAATLAATRPGDPLVLPVTVGLASLSMSPDAYPPGTRLGFLPQFRLAWREEVQKAFGGTQTIGEALDHAKARGDQLLTRFKETYDGVNLP